MDLDALKYLSDEDKARYMVLERLFAQPGWELVVKLAQDNMAASRDRAAFAQTWDANRIAVGQGHVWAMIATLQESTEAEFNNKAAEAKAAKQQQDEEDFE